jgi:pilus assembly protein Flp/PilA
MLPGRCMHLIIKFLKDESSATAIECRLIAAGIALAVIAVVNRLGTAVHNSFSTISTQLN